MGFVSSVRGTMWENRRTEAMTASWGRGGRERRHMKARERERDGVMLETVTDHQSSSQFKHLKFNWVKKYHQRNVQTRQLVWSVTRLWPGDVPVMVGMPLWLAATSSRPVSRLSISLSFGSETVVLTASLQCHSQLFAPRLTAVTSRLSTQTSLSPVWIRSHTMRGTSSPASCQPAVSRLILCHIFGRNSCSGPKTGSMTYLHTNPAFWFFSWFQLYIFVCFYLYLCQLCLKGMFYFLP